MKFKKTIINYIVWGLLCILTFAGIGVCAIGVSESMQNDAYLLYVGAFYAIFLAVSAALILGFRTLKPVVEKKIDFSKIHISGIYELIFLFIVIIPAVIIRLAVVIGRLTEVNGSGIINGSSAYFDYVLGNLETLGTGTNGAYLFTGLLKALFTVFGQNMIIIYILQTVFAVGIMILTFYAMKNAVNSMSAWIALLMVAFLPGSIRLVTYCTPGLMYAFLVSLYFFGIVMLFKAYVDDRIIDNKQLIFYAVAGIAAGFLCYFDPSAIVLLLLTGYGFFAFKDSVTESAVKKPVVQLGVYLGSAALFLLISLFAFPAGIAAGVTGIVRYFVQFVPKDGINLTILTPHYGMWDSVFLFCFTGLWLLAFLKCKKDRALAFAALGIVLVLFQLFTFDHVDYGPAISYCFVLLGTTGLLSLPVLILPAGVESKEEYKEKLAEIEKKRREKENHRFSRKIEKENKRASHSKSGKIILGKDVHMTAEGEGIIVGNENTTDSGKEETGNVIQPAADAAMESAASGIEPVSAGNENNKTTSEDKNTKQNASAEGTSEKISGQTASEEIKNGEKSTGESLSGERTAEVQTEESQVSDTRISDTKSDERQAFEVQTSEEKPSGERTEEAGAAGESVSESNVSKEETAAKEQPRHEENIVKEDTEAAKADGSAQNSVTRTGERIDAAATNESTAASTVTNTADTNSSQESEAKEESARAQTAPVKRELPPYVPQKMMIRRRGKMFSPVKKAEVPPEENAENTTETNTAPDDLKLRNLAVANAQDVLQNAGTTAVQAETSALQTETAVTTVGTDAVQTQDYSASQNEGAAATAQTAAVQAENTDSQTEAAVATAGTETVQAETAISSASVSTESAASETGPVQSASVSKVSEETAKTEAIEKKEESEKEVSQFKNPVPGPKPHVPRELAYDYDPKEEEMDFDITDLSGKDFYDV